MSGIRRVLQKVAGAVSGNLGRNLSRSEACDVFHRLLEGEGTDAEVAALFVAMRSKGATADELVGFSTASRERVRFPQVPEGGIVVATSRLGMLNAPPLSLAAAATAASCEVPVLLQAAPHAEGAGVTLGDLWQGLVGSMAGNAEQVSSHLERFSLACWEPTRSDPAWRRLLDLEEELGLRCLPDVLTKLLAPPATRLLVAAMPGPVLGTAGEALGALGHRHAMIVQGLEGSILPSVRQRTRGMQLEDGCKSPLRLEPVDLALECDSEPGFLHEDRFEAARGATMEALLGTEGPNLSAVLLCAGLMLRLSGRCRDLASAIGLARDAVESGAAQRRFQAVSSG